MSTMISRSIHLFRQLAKGISCLKTNSALLTSLNLRKPLGNQALISFRNYASNSNQKPAHRQLQEDPENPKIDIKKLGITNPFDRHIVSDYNDVSTVLLYAWYREIYLYNQSPVVGEFPEDAIARASMDLKRHSYKVANERETILESFYLRHNLAINFMGDFKFLDVEVQELVNKYIKNNGELLDSEYPNRPDIVLEWNSVLNDWANTEPGFDTESILNAVDLLVLPQHGIKFESKYNFDKSDKLTPEYLEYQQVMDKFYKDCAEGKIDFLGKDGGIGEGTLMFLDQIPKPNDKQDKNNDKKNTTKIIEFELTGDTIAKYSVIIALLLLAAYLSSYANEKREELTFQDFTAKFLSKNLVQRLTVVNNSSVLVELNENGRQSFPGDHHFHFNIGSIELFERSMIQVQQELKIADESRIPILYISEGSTLKVLINFIPTVLFLGAIYYMTKKAGASMGGPLGFGKSTAKKFNEESNIKTKFKDVAGMTEAKEEVMEFVKFLKNPEKYKKLGARIPRGAILSGPPGTGKTLLAKATAGEAGVPFYSVSGSEFIEMFVGVGALRVRDLFKTARENAPSIVFVDEIDAIGKQRAKGNASGANDERETTLNQLLVEMDGFNTDDHVVVLAGTNRADILDKALMRPGRFDRHIQIDNPELTDRKEIFDVHLKKIKLTKDIDSDLSGRLAALTPGFSGADIANVCNEAALIAARFNADSVTLRHFELAIERVIGGIEKKLKLLSPEEQKVVAYHEAGHAICGWFLKHASPLLKVSIIPRGQGALGYAQYLPADRYLESTAQLHDRMVMTLGGRVSEELHFRSVTSGAHDDFKKVTNVAQNMVLRFGMSPKVGMINYFDTRDSEDLAKPYSEETNRIIDSEVQRIIKECYDECRNLLTEKKAEVKLVADELLKKEFITREDMIRLLGKRPFPENNDAFDKYLDKKPAFKNDKPEGEYKDVE